MNSCEIFRHFGCLVTRFKPFPTDGCKHYEGSEVTRVTLLNFSRHCVT